MDSGAGLARPGGMVEDAEANALRLRRPAQANERSQGEHTDARGERRAGAILRDDDWQQKRAYCGSGATRGDRKTANEHGIWNDSETRVEIIIPPTFVQTKSFVALCVAAALLLLWVAYALRVRQVTARMRHRLEERTAERERIARELHDMLLQGVQGLILRFQDATEDIPHDTAARKKMEEALDRADEVLVEGRDRVKDLRTTPTPSFDLPSAIGTLGAGTVQGAFQSLRTVRRRDTTTTGADCARGSTAHRSRSAFECVSARARHEDRDRDHLPPRRIAPARSRRRLRN